MYSFQNDYSEGMQPAILRALETINYHQNHSLTDGLMFLLDQWNQ